MTNEKTPLTTVEIRWGENPDAILWVGKRAVHQYWALLGPYFRDVLLAPQRRPEDEIVAWTWRTDAKDRPPGAGELTALRKRLASTMSTFSENAREGAMGARGDAGPANQANIVQLAAVMETWVAGLLSKTDAELALYVARTESGLRLHSWGATAAAVPSSPVSGRSGADGASSVGCGPAPPRRRRRRLLGAGFAVLVLGALVWGGWVWSASRENEKAVARGAIDFTPSQPPVRLGEARAGMPEPEQVIEVEINRPGRAADSGADVKAAPPVPHFGNPASGQVAPSAAVAASVVAPVAAVPGSPQTPINPERPLREDMVRARESVAPGVAGVSPISSAGASPGSPGGAVEAGLLGGAAAVAASLGAATVAAVAAGSPAQVGAAFNRESVIAIPPPATMATSPAAPMPVPALTPPMAKALRVKPAFAAKPVEKSNNGLRNNRDSGVEAVESDGTPAVTDPPANERRVAANLPEAAADAPAEVAEKPLPDGGEVRVRSTRADAPDRRAPRSSAASGDAPAAVSGDSPTPVSSAFAEYHSGVPRVAWDQTVRVRVAEWRERLLGDAILPTAPMRAGQGNDVATLRRKMLAERRALMPATFSPVRERRGWTMEIDRPGAVPELRWRLPRGVELPGAVVRGRRAELAWTGGHQPPRGVYQLLDENDRGVARVEIEGDGAMTTQMSGGVRGWFWVGVERAVTEQADAARFEWRRMSGESLPLSWRPSAEERGARIDIPLGASGGARQVEDIVLFDTVTGWAVSTQLTHEPVASR